ncbi:MICOS complex subunit MIC13 isoform X4 [Ornithorhynchus anatinus]|uniref:MICOS complex subunit MIC13 isoform X4 n=1 Tax=Ornithorhynchus anatinus TaxID=9258 RepID=UPI0019D416B8|nr:MICOS complex subunit MIC13 isoform X4 [Ornithorhynchus anatinus]
MAPRLWPVVKFLVKGGVAGGTVYLVYQEGLLGSGDRGEAALKKAREVVPPALREWGAYLSRQTGVEECRQRWRRSPWPPPGPACTFRTAGGA